MVASNEAERVASSLNARRCRDGRGWRVKCPAHHDRKPSLWFGARKDGRAVFRCKAECTEEEIVAQLVLDGVMEPRGARSKLPPIPAELYRIEEVIAFENWSGRTGSHDWKILTQAHFAKALRERSTSYWLSDREAAELAGVGRDAIAASRPRLVKRGWLSIGERGRFGTRYTLSPPQHLRKIPSSSKRKMGAVTKGVLPSVDLYHDEDAARDAFRPGALGPSCQRIWSELDEPRARKDVRRRVGMPARTFQHAVARLLEAEAVAEVGGSLLKRTGKDLATVAEKFGTAGKTATLKRRHRDERKEFAEFLSKRQESKQEAARVAFDCLRKQKSSDARWQWNRSTNVEGTPAEIYLRARGIVGSIPAELRCYRSQRAAYLIAAVRDARGEVVSVQRTILLPDGTGRGRGRYNTGSHVGGAVRLGEPLSGLVAIAEGVETALSVSQVTGIPCWASLGATNLPAVEFPRDVHTVIVCGDDDKAGHEAAKAAADEFRRRGLMVAVNYPGRANCDYNDLLRLGVRFEIYVPIREAAAA